MDAFSAMPIIQCPSCALTLKISETAIGKNVKCRCGKIIAVPDSNQPKAKPLPSSTNAQPTSYLDQLTANDFQRSEKPKEQPTESQNKKNTDALAPFVKAESKSGKRTISDRERWDNIDAIYTIFFGLAILNIGLLILTILLNLNTFFSFRSLLFLPISLFLPSLLAATGFGLMLRKTWGWWSAILVLGLVGGAAAPWIKILIQLAIAIGRAEVEISTAFWTLAYGVFAFMISGFAIWMLMQLINYPVMKKFNVTMPLILAWVISIVGGYTAGLIYSYVLFQIIFRVVF